jgi:hypothetical protein
MRKYKVGDHVLVKHARYFWLRLVENRLTKRLFGSVLGRIVRLPLLAG